MAEVKLQRWLRHKGDGTIYVYDERMAKNPDVEEVVGYNVEDARKNPSVAEIENLTPERLLVMTKWQIMAFAWVRLQVKLNSNMNRDVMLKIVCDKMGIETPQLELSDKEKAMVAALDEVPADVAPVVPAVPDAEPEAPKVPAGTDSDLAEAVKLIAAGADLDTEAARLAKDRKVSFFGLRAQLLDLVNASNQTGDELTQEVYDRAAEDIRAGNITAAYAVTGISSHYKVAPEKVEFALGLLGIAPFAQPDGATA